MQIRVQQAPFDLGAETEAFADAVDGAGAVVTFTGVVREADTGRDVVLQVRNQRTTLRFDEAAIPLPAARIYASDVVERIRDLVEAGAVPTYTTIPGLPAWKDARFRADAAADGQVIDPRVDAVRARIFESEVER